MSIKRSPNVIILGALVVLLCAAAAFYFLDNASEDGQSAIPASARSDISRLNASLPGECRFDAEKPVVDDYRGLVNFFDPVVGNPNASVTVIEYFDPNCPHCQVLHPIMKATMEAHSDKAQFVFKPFVIFQQSITQSEALYAAAQAGTFLDMLDLQFEMMQPQSGLSAAQLREIAQQIGMNPEQLMGRIESGIFRSTLAQEKQKGVDVGVDSTPSVLINGRFVAPSSRTEECLGLMIEAVAGA